jgi:hypothetical protein
MVGVGWQLPDEALICLCVGESVSLRGNDAHLQLPENDEFFALITGLVRHQYLVARAGGWECYVRASFPGQRCNYPGLCFRLGDLRGAWGGISPAVKDAQTLIALGGEGGGGTALEDRIQVAFGAQAMTVQFLDVSYTLKAVE